MRRSTRAVETARGRGIRAARSVPISHDRALEVLDALLGRGGHAAESSLVARPQGPPSRHGREDATSVAQGSDPGDSWRASGLSRFRRAVEPSRRRPRWASRRSSPRSRSRPVISSTRSRRRYSVARCMLRALRGRGHVAAVLEQALEGLEQLVAAPVLRRARRSARAAAGGPAPSHSDGDQRPAAELGRRRRRGRVRPRAGAQRGDRRPGEAPRGRRASRAKGALTPAVGAGRGERAQDGAGSRTRIEARRRPRQPAKSRRGAGAGARRSLVAARDRDGERAGLRPAQGRGQLARGALAPAKQRLERARRAACGARRPRAGGPRGSSATSCAAARERGALGVGERAGRRRSPTGSRAGRRRGGSAGSRAGSSRASSLRGTSTRSRARCSPRPSSQAATAGDGLARQDRGAADRVGLVGLRAVGEQPPAAVLDRDRPQDLRLEVVDDLLEIRDPGKPTTAPRT